MSSYLKVGLFAVFLVAICCAVTWFMIQAVDYNDSMVHENAHQWLHDQLDLSPAESEALEDIEVRYSLRRNELKLQFQERKARLANILVEDEQYSEAVTDAVEEIHLSHGALQKLSIRHYFDMLEVLSAENRDKLKSLAAEALSQPE